MRTGLLSAAAAALLTGLLAVPAQAQYGATPIQSDRPIGETYHVEVFGGFWPPSPDVVISSEQFGIIGTDIDFVEDLGIEKQWFGDLRVVLRPTTKSKFRIAYTPISYDASTVLSRRIVFNGQEFRVSAPVDTEVRWRQWRFGYEYDFVYRDKGYAGLILDVRYTDVQATLTSSFAGVTFSEFTHAKAPIPAIGGIGRVYVMPNVAVTFELAALKVPKINDEYEATFIDWDLNGTFNVNENFGAQVGFRNLSVNYLVEQDTGDMVIRGLYFGAVARF
ncbi:MAG TPA: hypothetical protein VK886_11755 [Vicinamibacterales bacterium]|nr:hypothetical protein [Vicinamibacterales bacterium]